MHCLFILLVNFVSFINDILLVNYYILLRLSISIRSILRWIFSSNPYYVQVPLLSDLFSGALYEAEGT